VASKSHVGRYCFAALTAILQSEKLILPRSGEALTLRVSPRGFLKASTGGRPSGRPYLIRPWPRRAPRGAIFAYGSPARHDRGICCRRLHSHRVLPPALPRHSPAADELASKDFDGANYRAALGKIALRGMRRPTALSQAMASG
jgi:hypothetical protein